MLTKSCTSCDSVKTLSEYYSDNRNSDGRGGQCKECRLAQMRSRYADVEVKKKETSRISFGTSTGLRL